MAPRFKLYYRLTAECSWHETYAQGIDILGAKVALLLAIKTIYRIGGKGIEIVESFTDTPYPIKETKMMWPPGNYECY